MELNKIFTSRNVIIFIVIVVLIWAIYMYANSKTSVLDKMESPGTTTYPTSASGDAPFKTAEITNLDKPDQSSGLPNRAPTNPLDLLPSNTGNASWGNIYPVQNAGGVYIPSVTDPAFSIGIDSISNTLKNPNLDLRSEVPIPKTMVSPWNNSSYEPNIAKIGLDPGPSVM